MNPIWEQISASWRAIIKANKPDILIEDITNQTIKEVQKSGLLMDAEEYLDSEEVEDEEEDWP